MNSSTRPPMIEARNAFRSGDATTARRLITATCPRSGDMRTLLLLAQIDYLDGRYSEAIEALHGLRERTIRHPILRYRATRLLSLAYFQTNRYDEAASLPLRDHLTELMRSFPVEPYLTSWNPDRRIALPFLQQTDYELPRMSVEINGVAVVAALDTGGDLLSVPWSMKEEFDLRPVASAQGVFAGGRRHRTGWGRVDRVDLGDTVLRNVPVSLTAMAEPVLGTGLLRQFLTTVDYPARQLVLRPSSSRAPDQRAGIPFRLAGTHMLIADGRLNDKGPMQFLIDSGLEVDNDGAVMASLPALGMAGIPAPVTEPVEGISGAGTTQLNIGRFEVRSLSVGTATRHDLVGLTGIFPKQLTKRSTLGFPLHGLVSHNFLRYFRWTLDFDQMSMTLETPNNNS